MKLYISSTAQKAIDTLENAGFEAFCVGGAVRDMLMGRDPQDYDITTNASPDQIMRIFPHNIPTGIKHGTITAMIDHQAIEITTYRTDGSYDDGRHPKQVEFVDNITHDLARRDFTINAIAYSPTRGLIDPFGGVQDIKNKIIRCVGDADTRFTEDHLRIARCFRFATTLGFDIESCTLASAEKLLPSLWDVSRERVFTELTKALCGANFGQCSAFLGSGASTWDQLDAEPHLRFTAWCISEGRDAAKTAASLKASNDFIKRARAIQEAAQMALSNPADVRHAAAKTGSENLLLGQQIRRVLLKKATSQQLICNTLASDFPTDITQLAVDGTDIISLGAEGKEIGRVLKHLFDAVLDDPSLNNREALIEMAKKII